MAITLGVFEVATLTLVASALTLAISYFNFRETAYTSKEARQVELSKAIDGNTISYSYSHSEDVENNTERYINTLEAEVRSPRIYNKSVLESERKELKSKYLPFVKSTRYTRVQLDFTVEAKFKPDLYDFCIYSSFNPPAGTSDFSSLLPDYTTHMTTINKVGEDQYEIEVRSDKPSNVIESLDLFYSSYKTAIVRKALRHDNDLHPMIRRDIRLGLEEMIEDMEEAEFTDESLITGPPFDDEMINEFRTRLQKI